MKISIITVTYNSESFLKECIESVLSQNYEDIEHVVIDGNSKDCTLQIIKSFDHLKYISESDSGIYDAINKGISLSTGDVIGVLHSDDILADAKVIDRIAREFKDLNIRAVISDVQFVQRYDTGKALRYYSSKYFKPWMFKFGFQPAHPTFYARRELFEKFGSYRTDLKIAGDFEILLRFLKKNKVPFRYINDLWVTMRVGGVSTSGISSVLKLNDEILRAHHHNGLYTNKILIYSKYLIKWWSFLKKR
jgi:glycosyltransferase involved in cell wall biosynthesis